MGESVSLFREPDVETCQFGFMSGNRKQNQAEPDRGDAAKALSNYDWETYSHCACSRLYSPYHQ